MICSRVTFLVSLPTWILVGLGVGLRRRRFGDSDLDLERSRVTLFLSGSVLLLRLDVDDELELEDLELPLELDPLLPLPEELLLPDDDPLLPLLLELDDTLLRFFSLSFPLSFLAVFRRLDSVRDLLVLRLLAIFWPIGKQQTSTKFTRSHC